MRVDSLFNLSHNLTPNLHSSFSSSSIFTLSPHKIASYPILDPRGIGKMMSFFSYLINIFTSATSSLFYQVQSRIHKGRWIHFLIMMFLYSVMCLGCFLVENMHQICMIQRIKTTEGMLLGISCLWLLFCTKRLNYSSGLLFVIDLSLFSLFVHEGTASKIELLACITIVPGIPIPIVSMELIAGNFNTSI